MQYFHVFSNFSEYFVINICNSITVRPFNITLGCCSNETR